MADSSKMLSDRGIRLKLAAGCIAVLALGSWSAPQQHSVATSEERAAPLLAEQVQRQEEARASVDWPRVANQFAVVGIEVKGSAPAMLTSDFRSHYPQPTFALPVSMRHAITHHSAVGGGGDITVATPSGGFIPASIAAVNTKSGMVVLEATADLPFGGGPRHCRRNHRG